MAFIACCFGFKDDSSQPYIRASHAGPCNTTQSPHPSPTPCLSLADMPGPFLQNMLGLLGHEHCLALMRTCRSLRDMVLTQRNVGLGFSLPIPLADDLDAVQVATHALDKLLLACRLASRVIVTLDGGARPSQTNTDSATVLMLVGACSMHNGTLDAIVSVQLQGLLLDALLPAWLSKTCPNLTCMKISQCSIIGAHHAPSLDLMGQNVNSNTLLSETPDTSTRLVPDKPTNALSVDPFEEIFSGSHTSAAQLITLDAAGIPMSHTHHSFGAHHSTAPATASSSSGLASTHGVSTSLSASTSRGVNTVYSGYDGTSYPSSSTAGLLFTRVPHSITLPMTSTASAPLLRGHSSVGGSQSMASTSTSRQQTSDMCGTSNVVYSRQISGHVTSHGGRPAGRPASHGGRPASYTGHWVPDSSHPNQSSDQARMLPLHRSYGLSYDTQTEEAGPLRSRQLVRASRAHDHTDSIPKDVVMLVTPNQTSTTLHELHLTNVLLPSDEPSLHCWKQQLRSLYGLVSLSIIAGQVHPRLLSVCAAAVGPHLTHLRFPCVTSHHIPHLAPWFPAIVTLWLLDTVVDDVGTDALLGDMPTLRRLHCRGFRLQCSHMHHTCRWTLLGVTDFDVQSFDRLPLPTGRSHSVNTTRHDNADFATSHAAGEESSLNSAAAPAGVSGSWRQRQAVVGSGLRFSQELLARRLVPCPDVSTTARVLSAVSWRGGLYWSTYPIIDNRLRGAGPAALVALMPLLSTCQAEWLQISHVRPVTRMLVVAIQQHLNAPGLVSVRFMECTFLEDVWPVLLPCLPATVRSVYLAVNDELTESQITDLCVAAPHPVEVKMRCVGAHWPSGWEQRVRTAMATAGHQHVTLSCW